MLTSKSRSRTSGMVLAESRDVCWRSDQTSHITHRASVHQVSMHESVNSPVVRSGMMSKLTVITMNCLGLPVPIPGLRRRLQALGRTLATTDADVVCLQEVGRWRHLMLLRHDEPRWPFTIAVDYPYAPKGGLVTLAHLPVVDTQFYTFQERGRPVSLHTPERFQGKGILLAEIDTGTQNVVVINTHLAANYSAEWSYSNLYAKVERE